MQRSTESNLIVVLNVFGHSGQFQRRIAIGAGDIIVHKCMLRDKCTLRSIGRQLDTSGERSDTGPTTERAF